MDKLKFKKENFEYRSERVIIYRDFKEEIVLNFLSGYLDVDKHFILMKYEQGIYQKGKALLVFLLRRFSDLFYRDICKFIGNITMDRVSILSEKGMKLYIEKYPDIVGRFMEKVT